MTLARCDEIQIEGEHPTHPVTGAQIPGLLQYFMVTRDQEGDTIDPRALHPWPGHDTPIAMTRICRLNGAPHRK